MRICYLDESGTPELSGDSSHFVLLGLSIQGETWKHKDDDITVIKRRFGLEGAEIHSGWLSRRYLEQERIPNFDMLGQLKGEQPFNEREMSPSCGRPR